MSHCWGVDLLDECTGAFSGGAGAAEEAIARANPRQTCSLGSSV